MVKCLAENNQPTVPMHHSSQERLWDQIPQVGQKGLQREAWILLMLWPLFGSNTMRYTGEEWRRWAVLSTNRELLRHSACFELKGEQRAI
jgi:hypothetical protein